MNWGISREDGPIWGVPLKCRGRTAADEETEQSKKNGFEEEEEEDGVAAKVLNVASN